MQTLSGIKYRILQQSLSNIIQDEKFTMALKDLD